MNKFLMIAIPSIVFAGCCYQAHVPQDGEITFEIPDAGPLPEPCADAGPTRCLIDQPCYCRFTRAESDSGYVGIVAHCFVCESGCNRDGDGCFLYPQPTRSCGTCERGYVCRTDIGECVRIMEAP